MYNVHRAAYTGRRCAEKAQEGMTIFRSELESAVIRVSATLDTSKMFPVVAELSNVKETLQIIRKAPKHR